LNENELSPIPLHYEMDNGKTVSYKIPYNENYLGWVLIKKTADGAFRSLVFWILTRLFTVNKRMKN